jgi:hypothetical protein
MELEVTKHELQELLAERGFTSSFNYTVLSIADGECTVRVPIRQAPLGHARGRQGRRDAATAPLRRRGGVAAQRRRASNAKAGPSPPFKGRPGSG